MNFKNEPPTDFSTPANRAAMEQALREVRSKLGASYPIIVNGKRLKARSSFRSLNPSRPEEVVGIVQNADKKIADNALEGAKKNFPSWSKTPAAKRAEVLVRMAELLRRRKFAFCAWMIYEVGKNWAEADADVAEAIDFLNYYTQLALLPPPVLAPVAGEENAYRYLPLGPVLV